MNSHNISHTHNYHSVDGKYCMLRVGVARAQLFGRPCIASCAPPPTPSFNIKTEGDGGGGTALYGWRAPT